MPRKLRLIVLVVLAPFLAMLGWAFLVEPNRLVVRREALAIPELPALRVALISDLHAGARFMDGAKIRDIVDKVNAERPELILLLGDYLNNGRYNDGRRHLKGGALAPEPVAKELGRLRASAGVVAVLGNHDWWFDGKRIAAELRSNGITVLENEATPVELRSGRLWIAGIADAMTRTPEIARALSLIPEGAPVLAVSHSPDIFPAIPARVALTVAGHTHGGQVALPWIGAPIVPSRFGQRYAKGHVEERGRLVFVTSGIGTSLLPVRFGVPPEVVILTLN
jgi:predicted MPP superfamily phosphohydrolase